VTAALRDGVMGGKSCRRRIVDIAERVSPLGAEAKSAGCGRTREVAKLMRRQASTAASPRSLRLDANIVLAFRDLHAGLLAQETQ
jgi:hypothetical protein